MNTSIPPAKLCETANGRVGLCLTLSLCALLSLGCSNSSEPETNAGALPPTPDEVQSAADLAAAGKTPDVGADTFGQTEASARERADGTTRSQPAGSDLTGMEPADPMANPQNLIPMSGFPVASGSGGGADAQDTSKLRSDLTTSELTRFLSEADRDMELIATGRAGITEENQARATMLQIVEQKLEAARQLTLHEEASEEDKITGIRGQMQALSHMAGSGDVQAAKKLEVLAREQLDSSDNRLATDSQIVLIGFAIESLRNGRPNANQKMVELINQLAESKNVDVAAMMVMGQARNTLAMYGHAEDASQVGETIAKTFGDSADPTIATMAQQLAGSARYDETNLMLNAAMEGKPIELSDWTAAANRLIDSAPDLTSVQQLAGAALQFEALQQPELAAETYRVLDSRFTEPESETRTELEIALAAKKRREDVIGTVYQPSLPAVDGAPLSLSDYRGKVILMPFWAITLQESLQVIPQLKLMQDADPENIAIVGINLDPQDAPVETFVQKSELGFRSFRSISSAQQRVANPVAVQFGAVSFPFVVIIDQEGKVAGLDFSGMQLQSVVKGLLEPK